MRVIHEQFRVAGLPLRTNNREASRTIPAHWDAFAQADVAGRLGVEGDVFAVYTDHEHEGQDNLGEYTLVIGHRVEGEHVVPSGLIAVTVPASLREVIVLEPGRPDLVGDAWEAIWKRDDLALSYLADFERYGDDGAIEISLGLRAVE
jgi:predicted transcriptional regulator YdeE